MEWPFKKFFSKIASKCVSKKVGCGVDLRVNSLNTSKHNGRRKIHISLDAETDKGNIRKILKNLKNDKKSKK